VKEFSQACENNKRPILDVLRVELAGCRRVLEIGSGSGQHAAFLALHLPHLRWQPSDLSDTHASIVAWCEESPTCNVEPPMTLDVGSRPWPSLDAIDAVFTANTLHIMSWPLVETLFEEAAGLLVDGGVLCAYGPFNYGGRYTSPSNEDFDAWLKGRDPCSGIRDFEAVVALAAARSMSLLKDHAMPANNRILVWRKTVT
jgi:SAM-dependent methyltransferase